MIEIMKKFLFSASLLILILAGCTEAFNEGSPAENRQASVKDSHNVTLSTVRTLIGRNAETRSDDEANKLVCIKDALNDTLLYMCDNEGGGWTIYSSDTRVPPIVAQSETGTIEDLQKLEAAMDWIQSLSNDMKAIRQAEDSELNFSSNEIEQNKYFWKAISSPDECVKSIMRKPDSLTLINPNPDLINWEDYGLYYLHNYYGVPKTAPSKAYCHGRNTDKDYDWSQYDFTMDAWDSMNKKLIDEDTGIEYWGCAPFIAYIGNLLKTKYGDEGSSSDFPMDISRVFNPLGISCKVAPYDVDILKQSLLIRCPFV